MQIVARVELPGESIDCIVERAAIERGKIAPLGPVGDAADGKANAVRPSDSGAGDDGEIAVPAAEFAGKRSRCLCALPAW